MSEQDVLHFHTALLTAGGWLFFFFLLISEHPHIKEHQTFPNSKQVASSNIPEQLKEACDPNRKQENNSSLLHWNLVYNSCLLFIIPPALQTEQGCGQQGRDESWLPQSWATFDPRTSAHGTGSRRNHNQWVSACCGLTILLTPALLSSVCLPCHLSLSVP